jgi:endo-1,4-beta-xylanase
MKRIPAAILLTAVSLALSPALGEDRPALKDAFKNSFLIGAALNARQFTGKDERGAALVRAQFNSITPENVFKWESIHPRPGSFDFDAPDRFVEFGEQNHMFIVGHTLVWHNQTPKWVFVDDKGAPLSRGKLLKRMREHIHKVVRRYRGRVRGWDVVNEALNDDGTLRPTPWFNIIGEDFIAKAFQYAHEADPKAELYYNDYSLENEPKRNGAVALLKKLKAAGVPVTGVGIQGHDNLQWPTIEQEDATISAFADLGLKVMITELDVDVLPSAIQGQSAEVTQSAEYNAKLNPYKEGLPDSVQEALARRYADLFRVFLKHADVVTRVTFWGVTDGDSWKNNWPVPGRTNYPLLFDREGRPKPAFDAVVHLGKAEASEAGSGVLLRVPSCPLWLIRWFKSNRTTKDTKAHEGRRMVSAERGLAYLPSCRTSTPY